MTTHANRWNRTEVLLVVALLVLAAVARFAALGDSPRGLFRDEWEKGYTALELWRTGRHGVPGSEGLEISRALPLFIEIYQGHDRTSAIYQYATAPIVGIFGLNAFTTRFAAAAAGWLTCLFVWLLARRAISWQAGIGALASAAFHPTGILFSRWAQQGSMAIMFAVLGAWLLFEAISNARTQRRAIVTAAAMAFGISAYAYDPARLVVPLMIAAFVVTQWPSIKQHRRAFLPAAIVFAAMWIPLVIYTVTMGSARLARVSSGLSAFQIISNYCAHFTPWFFMTQGDVNPRHGGVERLGFVAWLTGIYMVIAVIALVAQYRRANAHRIRSGTFLFLWLAAGPTAAALTNEGIPHALRACLMIPATSLLAGYAVDWIACSFKRGWFLAAAITLSVGDGMLGGLMIWAKQLSPSADWNTGLVGEIRRDVGSGRHVFLSAQIPYANYAALFAEATDPLKYHEENLGALKTRLVIDMPALTEGDVQILPLAGNPYSTPILETISSHIAIERRNGETVCRIDDGGAELPYPPARGRLR
ncbi:MAG: glycosyltransferase family 39 protein [Candidatus Sumerlaeota bacterium]